MLLGSALTLTSPTDHRRMLGDGVRVRFVLRLCPSLTTSATQFPFVRAATSARTAPTSDSLSVTVAPVCLVGYDDDSRWAMMASLRGDSASAAKEYHGGRRVSRGPAGD